MSVYREDNFAGRVRYARMVILSGRTTRRAFDLCFTLCQALAAHDLLVALNLFP